MRARDRKRMGPADTDKAAKNRRRARAGLTLLGIILLVAGLLLVVGRFGDGAGSRDGNDTAAVAESNETDMERNETEDTEEPRVNETETTETKTETNETEAS